MGNTPSYSLTYKNTESKEIKELLDIGYKIEENIENFNNLANNIDDLEKKIYENPKTIFGQKSNIIPAIKSIMKEESTKNLDKIIVLHRGIIQFILNNDDKTRDYKGISIIIHNKYEY